MNTRRQILSLIGAAPVAASGAKAEIAALLSSPAIAAASSLIGGRTGREAPFPQAQRLTGPVGDLLMRLREEAENEMFARRAIRVGGLDADLHAFKSLSGVRKSRLQYERDFEESDIIRRAGRTLWG